MHKDEIKKLHMLSGLRFSESDDMSQFIEKIDSVIDWISVLKKVSKEADGVETMITPIEHSYEIHFKVKEEDPVDTNRDDIIKNAPKSAEGFFCASKVIK